MKSIEVIELKEQLKNKKVILLDVREQYEIDIANIKGSLNIPMMEVPNRLSELKKEEIFAVMCHSGIRSAQVCNFLEMKGFTTYNVSGGIDKWSQDVDNKIKRY